MRVRILFVIVAGICTACGAKAKPAPLTERQRDSVIGESKLPGATGVRGAMRLSDSQAARNARFDSISRQQP